MSYVSSFVHAEPTAKIVVTEQPTAKKNTVHVAAKKETTTKILLFVAILACLVVAVSF